MFLFESNPTISDILIKNAKTARMEVDVLHDQEEALTLREKELENYAGILVGNMDDPFEVVDRLRLNGVKTPILMLSERWNWSVRGFVCSRAPAPPSGTARGVNG